MNAFQKGYWLARQIRFFREHPLLFLFFVLIPFILTVLAHVLIWSIKKPWRIGLATVFLAFWYRFDFQIALYAVPATIVAYMLAWIAYVSQRGTAVGAPAILAGVYHLIRIRRLWALTCTATGFLTYDSLPVPAHNWRITQHGIRADLSVGAMGRAEMHALNFKDPIRSTLYVDRVRMKKLSSGIVRMWVEWGDHLKKFTSLSDIPMASSPDMLAVGVKENGTVFELPIGKSVLAVGLTGTGKSSFAWALVYALIRAGIPFRLTIGNPKFVEWKIAKESMEASPIVYRYTDSPYQLGKGGLGKGQFMWEIQHDLTEKLKKIPVGQRIATPTEEDPLDIIIIDETLPLTDELRKEKGNHPLAMVTYQGRAAGSWCIFLSQTAEKDVIGPVRDLVPIVLAFSVKSREQADMALGSGSVNKGLVPHMLDPVEDVGICYYSFDTGDDGPARIGFATDYDIPYLIMGQIPPPPPSEVDKYSYDRPCYVYEYYGLDENNQKECKYIGEAYDWQKRFKQHEEKEPEMMAEVIPEWTVVDLWPSKASAETEEVIRIKKVHPKWNKQHNAGYYRGT